MTRTTLPVLPAAPSTLQTARLLLRPFSTSDLPHYIILRRQPEVMKWTSTMRCDATITQTQEWMARFLPCENPNTFPFSIEELENPGVVIGSAGCNCLPGKQPELGYMLIKEMWGKGYATEAVRVVLEAYWGLQRKEVEVQVEAEMQNEGRGAEQELDKDGKAWAVDKDAAGLQVEKLEAVVDATNTASRKVLEKFGFVKTREYQDENTGGTECVLYVLRRPGS